MRRGPRDPIEKQPRDPMLSTSPGNASSPTACFLLFSFCSNKRRSSLLLLRIYVRCPPSVLASICLCEEPRLLGSHPEALTLAISLDYTDKLQQVMVTACSSWASADLALQRSFSLGSWTHPKWEIFQGPDRKSQVFKEPH